jgi:hypothetical protein
MSAAVIPIAYQMDTILGFDMDPNAHSTVGYLTQFQIGSTTLAADITIEKPAAQTTLQKVTVVGVMSELEWDGAPTDPMTVGLQFSQENEQTMLSYLGTNPASVVLRFAFAVMAWDPAADSWYTAFSSPSLGPISTAPVVSNGKIQVSVSTTGVVAKDGTEVLAYPMTFSAAAPSTAQVLSQQTSADDGIARVWGR